MGPKQLGPYSGTLGSRALHSTAGSNEFQPRVSYNTSFPFQNQLWQWTLNEWWSSGLSDSMKFPLFKFLIKPRLKINFRRFWVFSPRIKLLFNVGVVFNKWASSAWHDEYLMRGKRKNGFYRLSERVINRWILLRTFSEVEVGRNEQRNIFSGK